MPSEPSSTKDSVPPTANNDPLVDKHAPPLHIVNSKLGVGRTSNTTDAEVRAAEVVK